VHRLYAEVGLWIRTKLPRRKRAWRYRQVRPRTAPNEVCGMNFMSN
jgi:putative transposase